MDRRCGILMPIFSLASKYGIGTFSKEAYDFVDWLAKAGQTYWQILPLGPTGYGDSPYQSFSSFAGNPYFIDLETLCKEGLLDEKYLESIDWGSEDICIDYGKIWQHRQKVLRIAYEASKSRDFSDVADVGALDEETGGYCLYKAIKNAHDDESYLEWNEMARHRDKAYMETFASEHADEIEFYRWIQKKFMQQWHRLKSYANEKGILIIGDIPIYVSQDSADAWAHPELFKTDEQLRPTHVAGCPPDYFSPDGQLWGNPVYNWEAHERDGYEWWIHRMRYTLEMYDIVRIDHFRGFDEYFEIEAGATNAKEGVWQKGPGMKLFDAMKKALAMDGSTLPIIAEDLGYITDSVRKLVEDTGFPGMKVLQFAYDSDEHNQYLLHNHIKNCVVYTGTHDNQTLFGWIHDMDEKKIDFIRAYQSDYSSSRNHLYMDCIRHVMMSVADTVIVPLADYLGKWDIARINTPSTSDGNWTWRMRWFDLDDYAAEFCYEIAKIHARVK